MANPTPKTRRRPRPRRRTAKTQPVKSPTPILARLPVFALFAVLLFAAVFRIYKAHCSGIIHDEAWTYTDFAQNVHQALTFYNTTNNHLLNSVLIVLTGKVFGSYEHFIRIPAVLFGLLFCAAMTYIVNKTIRTPVLKIVVLALILMNWFILDLTFLARGYAIALGAVFTGIAILVHLLTKPPCQRVGNWRLVLALTAINFIAFGAMLSSLAIVISLNLAFAVITLAAAIPWNRTVLIRTLIRLAVIALASAGSVLLLYLRVLPDVRRYADQFPVEPFRVYLDKILHQPFIYDNVARRASSEHVYTIALIVLAVCSALYLGLFIYRLKTRSARLFALTPARLIAFLAATILVLMYLQSNVLHMSLGMPRNGVFLLPLVLLTAGIILERASHVFAFARFLPPIHRLACAAVLASLCLLNVPTTQAVVVRPFEWRKQSAIGPLCRTLRQTDPERHWKILLLRYSDCLQRSIDYYNRVGFHVQRTYRLDDWDLCIVPPNHLDPRAAYIDVYSYTDHRILIMVNPASFPHYPLHRLTPQSKP